MLKTRHLILLPVACASLLAAAAPDKCVKEELVAQVELVSPEALVRLADDWENTWGTGEEVTSLRRFAAVAAQAKAAALAALETGDFDKARNLLKEQRMTLARHPLVRDLEILAIKHTDQGVVHELDPDYEPGRGHNVYKKPKGQAARYEPHPGLPALSCYNNLDVEKNQPSSIIVLSRLGDDEPSVREVYRPAKPGTIHSVDLDFDGRRLLFVAPDPATSNAWRLFETDVSGTAAAKALLPAEFIHEAADCCWLPDGRIVFTSDAGEQGLPCETGRVKMSNMYRLDPSNGKVDRLTYDQDSDWYPSVLNDGRVQYVRWEYCDISHFFSRIVMTMNPDGTRQMGFYGSNEYWPNHFGSPLAIPGDNGKFICVATGHHTPKSGKLCLFDVEKGHTGGKGAVQMLPGWGKPPDVRIEDRLYINEFPRFLQPFPLGTSPADGAGKFFLAAMKPSPRALWGIYLVDVFDNVTLIAETEGWSLNEPIALKARKRPPSIPDRRRENVPYCTMYCGDIYQGEGLKGVPRGTVKAVRLFAYHYGFHHAAGHDSIGLESSYDMKYVLGTVPVTDDCSVIFDAPVNKPISIQPLAADGSAIQLMRSWTVGMPGEYVSCIGCHENPSVTARPLQIVRRKPSPVTPPGGLEKPRTWSFLREIQPILKRRCSGCHDKDADPAVARRQPDERGVRRFSVFEHELFTRGDKPNLADIRPMRIQYKTSTFVNGPVIADGQCKNATGGYSKSYYNLVPWVRHPGPESDNRLLNPMEYNANTSPLVQILKAGHHGVELTDDEWRTLYTWIDLNAPFWGTWTDQVTWMNDANRRWAGCGTNHVENLRKLECSHRLRQYAEKRFQGFWSPDDDPELDTYDYAEAERDLAKIVFEPPKGFKGDKGFKGEKGFKGDKGLNGPKSSRQIALDLPGGKLAFREAADGVWFAETELPLANYLAFRPDHYNGFIDWLGKDHNCPGESVMSPNQPVIRVSFNEAKEYAAWLSEKTGRKFRLPTEEEWENAARAGMDGDYAWGNDMPAFTNVANLADARVDALPNQFSFFNPHLHHPTSDDGEMTVAAADTKAYVSNGYGLFNMIGNVEEWCEGPDGGAVARGGAFDTLPRRATFAHRVPYLSWQRVYNTGVRLVMEYKQ